MSNILFEALKVVVMLAVLVLTRYLVPWIKEKIGAERINEIAMWTKTAVLMVQQVYNAKSGSERKTIVVDLLYEILRQKNIAIAPDQLDMLIEAAVKTMKMQEQGGNKG